MTINAIPASAIVAVTPSVLGAGGTALDINGLALDNSTRVPIGTVLSFASAADVGAYFGLASSQAAFATVYFSGFDNSNKKPGELLITQYPQVAVSAWLRGGKISSLTLAQLQAISGTFTVTVDGVAHTTASINLSSATSFSNGATIINTALDAADCTFTGAISTTTLTVSVVASGTLAVGQIVTGTGVAANTIITADTGGGGGAGTYTVSVSQTVGSESMVAGGILVTYDSTAGAYVITSGSVGATESSISYASGSAAAPLLLTLVTGAVLSQGADAATPVAFMGAVILQTQNWATFTTMFDPDASGNDNKLAFATWVNGTISRYVYVAWDTDVTPTESTDAASSLGQLIMDSALAGTCLFYSPSQGPSIAAFVMGYGASLDFTELNGRATLAFRSQSGLSADVTNQTVGNNLLANGYNFYGAYATANDSFIFAYNGSVSGQFLWLDSYVNQIWLNNALQLALLELLITVKSIPYNQAGYTLIKAAAADPINQALNFGAIRSGVSLSAAQTAEVNSAAGLNIATTLTNVGYYFQVLDATAQTRAARESPPCTLWYVDGQSVQQINLASIEVQ